MTKKGFLLSEKGKKGIDHALGLLHTCCSIILADTARALFVLNLEQSLL